MYAFLLETVLIHYMVAYTDAYLETLTKVSNDYHSVVKAYCDQAFGTLGWNWYTPYHYQRAGWRHICFCFFTEEEALLVMLRFTGLFTFEKTEAPNDVARRKWG
jgi:hypothetical protein